MARQGHSFATAQEVRVVYPLGNGTTAESELVDVPRDGKTIGEIVTRGNLVMKEVRLRILHLDGLVNLTCACG
jgi:hypothetical protein